jgi:hypothetical protein
VSPIYVRPEREQAEHDRLIRFLQAKYSRKFEAVANPGDERVAPVKVAAVTHFPDLVLTDASRLAGVVEIETAASVNNLETMAKWVPFSRARVPFHLYVPVQGYEAALRLAEAHNVKAAEIWTYRPAVEGFDLVRMHFDAALQAVRLPKAPAAKTKAAKVKPEKVKVEKPDAVKPAGKVAARAVAGKTVKSSPTPRPKRKAAAAKGTSKPAPRSKPAARRPAPAKKAAKPAQARPARPASKGGKKGAGARKGR